VAGRLLPGRIGAAFVSGYQSGDFELVGADFEHRMRAFADALPAAVRALAGDPALTGGDPAVSALAHARPVLAGAGGRVRHDGRRWPVRAYC